MNIDTHISEKPVEPCSILLVDDDPAIIKIFEYGLRDRGYEVHSARNGMETRKLAKTLLFDCLITDINLPDSNGIDLKAELVDLNPKLITILMTGYPGIKTAIKGLREDVQDYLIKPFSVDQVVSSLERARSAQRLRDENAAYQERIESLEAELDEVKQKLAVYEAAKQELNQGALGARKQNPGRGQQLAAQSYQQQSTQQPQPKDDIEEHLEDQE